MQWMVRIPLWSPYRTVRYGSGHPTLTFTTGGACGHHKSHGSMLNTERKDEISGSIRYRTIPYGRKSHVQGYQFAKSS